MKEALRNKIRQLISEEFERKSLISEIRANVKLQNEVFGKLKSLFPLGDYEGNGNPTKDPKFKELYYKQKKEEIVKLIKNLENVQNKYKELDNKFKTLVGTDFHSYITKMRNSDDFKQFQQTAAAK